MITAAPLRRAAAPLRLPLAFWLERRRTRQALRALDTHLMKDVGLSPSETFREGRRWMWQGRRG